jgi:serine protease Do
MLNRTLCALTLLACCAFVAVLGADVVRLKGEAAVAGKILAEKPGEIAVDIGHTILVIPRSQILSVVLGSVQAPAADAAPSTAEDGTLREARAIQTLAPARDLPEAGTGPRSLFQAGSGADKDRSVNDLVSAFGEAVVLVRTPSGLGSGFIIHEDGFLITNFHVIEGETQILVEVYHQRQGQLERRNYREVKIIAANKFADLALLKIDDQNAPVFSRVPLGDSDGLGVGESVFAIGSPLGLERTVTEGIVSSKTRPIQGELYLQTTAQINPGNSGGPLFNLRGEVVGVTNMKVAFGDGIGFAIPIETVKHFLKHREAFAYDSDNPSSPYRYLDPPRRVSAMVVAP